MKYIYPLLGLFLFASCATRHKSIDFYFYNTELEKEIKYSIKYMSEMYQKDLSTSVTACVAGDIEMSLTLVPDLRMPEEFLELRNKTNRFIYIEGHQKIPVIFYFDFWNNQNPESSLKTTSWGGYHIVFDKDFKVISKAVLF